MFGGAFRTAADGVAFGLLTAFFGAASLRTIFFFGMRCFVSAWTMGACATATGALIVFSSFFLETPAVFRRVTTAFATRFTPDDLAAAFTRSFATARGFFVRLRAVAFFFEARESSDANAAGASSVEEADAGRTEREDAVFFFPDALFLGFIQCDPCERCEWRLYSGRLRRAQRRCNGKLNSCRRRFMSVVKPQRQEEFAALTQKADPKDGAALHTVARGLQQRFCPPASEPEITKEVPVKPPDSAKPKSELPVVANAPLDFELKGLNREHPYLPGRGFTAETIAYFGLGYCSRGMLRERIAIPLHDQTGALLGYAGRVADDAKITEDNPRYRFPGDRKREGTCYAFRKTLFVYNGYRFTVPVEELIVVESFTAVWWLHQNGLPQVVSTMGSDCSDEQAALIVSLVKPDGRVWAFSDGDPAGERQGIAVLSKVSPHRFVRWVRLVEGMQPTNYSAVQLKAFMSLGNTGKSKA